MATLHVIYGLPGAGKTSLGRRLAAELEGTMFCEDEHLLALGQPIATLDDLIRALDQVRAVIGPLAIRALEAGRPVVFDFAGNTVAHRAWARSLAETAGAELVLHVLDVPVDECRRRVRARNVDRPAGLYFGDVSDDVFDMVVPHIVAPTEAEGLAIVREDRN